MKEKRMRDPAPTAQAITSPTANGGTLTATLNTVGDGHSRQQRRR